MKRITATKIENNSNLRYAYGIALILLCLLLSVAQVGAQTLSMSQSVTNSNPDPEVPFDYVISISCNSTTADCHNTVVSGYLPEPVDFLNFSAPLPSGVASATYDIATRYYEITFDEASPNALAKGSTIQMAIQAMFPGGTVENLVASNTANATSSNATNDSATASATVGNGGWTNPPTDFIEDKYGDAEQLPGGEQYYQVRIGNLGPAAIDNFQVIDRLPSVITLNQVRTPVIPYMNHAGQLYYERSDNLGVWNLWDNINLSTRTTRNVSGLGLPGGVKVTAVRLDLGYMSESSLYNTYRYADGFQNSLILYGTVDNGLADGVTYQNCADYYGTIGGSAASDQDCTTTTINSAIASNEVSGYMEFYDQTNSYITVANIGDTIKMRHTYYSEPEMTQDILGGVMTLVLPAGMSYIPGSLEEDWTCTQFDGMIPVVQTGNTIDGREYIRFVYDSSLGNEFNLDANGWWDGCAFYIGMVVGPSTPEGFTRGNYYFNATGSTHDNCGTADSDNYLNGYASTYCLDDEEIQIVRPPGSAGVRSEKFVTGTKDFGVYSQYPATATTVPGGLSNYRIVLTNPNATPIDNIEIIDILPHVGDTDILDESTQRFSEWRPNLAEPITTPSGITAFYTTVSNPCRDELAGSNPTPFPSGCTNPSWTTVAPADITDVTALKFELSGITLNQNDNVTIEYEMRAPVNAPTNDEIAWNSFAYVAENASNGTQLLPTEAIKVGIQMTEGTVPIAGDFVWNDLNGNGLQDSGEPGIDGVRVALIEDTNGNGSLGGSDQEYTWTITANGGQYIFSDFPTGRYFLEFTNFPSGYNATHRDVGGNDGLDSDGPISDLITFTGTSDFKGIDMGLFFGSVPPLWSCSSPLMSNSEFENNFNSWADWGNTSITSDTYVGNRAMLINGGQGGRGQVISVNPGETYRLSFYAKKNGSEEAYGGINFKDVSNNTIYELNRYVFDNVYEYHSLTVTAPANADRLEIFGFKHSGSGSAYFDAFCLELINDICASGETNSDADSVCDRYDIDDDNDGIRDIDESICRGDERSLVMWSHNTPANTAIAELNQPSLISSAANESYGAGLFAYRDETLLKIGGALQSNLSASITDNVYVQYAFTTAANIPALYLDRFGITKHGVASLALTDYYGYDYAVLISDNGFSSSDIIADVANVDENINPSWTTEYTEADDNFYYLKPSTTYTIRVYFFNRTTNPASDVWFDDFQVIAQVCDLSLDTDGDSYVNSLDLDSDNDGLTDLTESGHSAADANNDGIVDLAASQSGINGLYNGLETPDDIGAINYTLSDSENSPDGIYDPYELDSDGDGCYDTEEENISDSDENGLVGTGIPAVGSSGLVSGHTYGPPANNFWQDASLIKCLDVTGRIFEDINYGGGSGRAYAVANTDAVSSGWGNGAIAISGVRVELYDASDDFVASTTTNASGTYTFYDVGSGTHSIRVANLTVSSNRASNSTGQTPIGCQTYRHTGSTAVINEVGGFDPDKVDAGSNTTNSNISTLYTATTTVHSRSYVTLTNSNVSGVDFGFNFDVIVNENSGGQGSLRQFILNSNELANTNLDQEDFPPTGENFPKPAGTEHSIFMIGGIGLHTITPSTELPSISDTYTHITGYTQEGSIQGTIAGRTNTIQLSGNTTLFDALTIGANHTTISGLIINDFDAGIRGSGTRNNFFLWGNYIGSTSNGLAANGNTGYGIFLQNFTDSFIGTNGDNSNDADEGNLISDNYDGLVIRYASGFLIAGNIIGLNKNANVDLGNRFNGIYIRDATGVNVVGFNGALAAGSAVNYRNISSGNGNDGVRILNSDGQIISGNYFGTNGTGTVAFGNTNYGVQISGSSSNVIIGTDGDGDSDSSERNVMSGNGTGMRMQTAGTGSNNRVMGNYIGTNATGNAALGNSNNGLEINGSFVSNIIGTNGDNVNDNAERNVISGNNGDGIRIANTNSNIIAGNYIGLGQNGVTSIPNAQRGILIDGTAANNVIGYSTSMTNSNALVVGNRIKNNLGTAIGLSGSGLQNRISRNQMEDNGGIGIDLDYDGVTSNDNGDADTGPNNLYNFPVVTNASLNDDILTITGYAPAGSLIEVFAADAGPNPSPLPGGYTTSFGEGAVFLFDRSEGSVDDTSSGTGIYNNDGTGTITNRVDYRFSFSVDISAFGLVEGSLITATATDSNNNTSEFSGVFSILSFCPTATMNPHVMYYRRGN